MGRSVARSSLGNDKWNTYRKRWIMAIMMRIGLLIMMMIFMMLALPCWARLFYWAPTREAVPRLNMKTNQRMPVGEGRHPQARALAPHRRPRGVFARERAAAGGGAGSVLERGALGRRRARLRRFLHTVDVGAGIRVGGGAVRAGGAMQIACRASATLERDGQRAWASTAACGDRAQ